MLVAICADGLRRATLYRFLHAAQLVWRRGLVKHECPTALVLLTKNCWCCLIAKAAVDAGPLNIKFAWHVLRNSILEFGHTRKQPTDQKLSHPSAREAPTGQAAAGDSCQPETRREKRKA